MQNEISINPRSEGILTRWVGPLIWVAAALILIALTAPFTMTGAQLFDELEAAIEGQGVTATLVAGASVFTLRVALALSITESLLSAAMPGWEKNLADSDRPRNDALEMAIRGGALAIVTGVTAAFIPSMLWISAAFGGFALLLLAVAGISAAIEGRRRRETVALGAEA